MGNSSSTKEIPQTNITSVSNQIKKTDIIIQKFINYGEENKDNNDYLFIFLLILLLAILIFIHKKI